MSFTTVLTHNQQFHADDVVAVALLKYAGFRFDLVRTRDSVYLEKAKKEPTVLVLDVGEVFDPSMLNFDHHQDLSLISSAGMIWEHFKDEICPLGAQPFFGQFISAIDAIDTNRDNIYAVWNTLPKGFRNVSSIIAGFNRDATNASEQYGAFIEAVDFALVIIENEIIGAVAMAKSESDYSNRQILSNNVAVFEEFSNVWKDKAEHNFAIMPHASGWQIQSRDTSLFKVPESVESIDGFIFRHGSGFMATSKNKESLIKFAQNL